MIHINQVLHRVIFYIFQHFFHIRGRFGGRGGLDFVTAECLQGERSLMSYKDETMLEATNNGYGMTTSISYILYG